ncbi:HAD family hydrolase [Mycoplasma tauri]|uniref:HAD family hydrolase n=1 Tax=Mycoplasma tauri TaxID=547987 RepID=UPI0019677ECD|nr:HAD family hydrolase [Mycoplasma tauri]MBZ4203584.1 HAD family hydrolase [Mycoplasma tauri]MBZ4204537.1 HAD family hydrolase [Mycoplasma tauri]MBZ4212685.1 HAD family hydrolase [Mycoplasma tauri]MBZ4226789.1 HAD family hydrolase [Mycoplasma tauri]QSB07422.1 HAD family hydrolase [Mycoplasma tauri]
MKVKLNQIKYLFFDMDGTLLNKEKKINESVVQKIKELSKNHKVIINTGRSWYLCQRFHQQLGLDTPILGLNGALLYDWKKKEVFYSKPISLEISQKILSIVLQYNINLYMYFDKKMIGIQKFKQEWFEKVIYPNVYPLNELSADYTEYNNPPVDMKLDEPVIKFLLLIDPLSKEELQELKSKIQALSDDIYAISSQKGCLDIMPKGCDKGTAINSLKNKYLNGENIYENSIMFGDADNDIPAFRQVAYSVALKSHSEETEKAAKFVVSSSNEDGVIEFFDKYTE